VVQGLGAVQSWLEKAQQVVQGLGAVQSWLEKAQQVVQGLGAVQAGWKKPSRWSKDWERFKAGWKKPSRWSKDWERFKAGWKKSSRVVQGLGAVQSNARLQLPLDKTSGQRHRGIWFLSLTERPFHPNVTGAARHRCLSGGDLAPRQARMRRCIRRSSQSVQQEQFQQLCRRGLIRKPVRQRLRATPRWRLDRPALRRSRHQRGPFGSVLNI
jgi:hypothetical protein